MSERLTVSLEDGTLDKLRELAGGQRKVGAYLSDVVAWLWQNKETIESVSPSGWVILPGEKVGDLLGTDADTLAQLIEKTSARLDALEAGALQELREAERINRELLALVRLPEGRLPTQENSGSNDA